MMLLHLLRKLGPLLITTLVVGCGKEIGQNNTTPGSSIENQEFPSAYILQLDSSIGFRQSYQMPRNGVFQIPQQLKVRDGNASNRTVDVRYQANPNDSTDYQLKCSYFGATSTELFLVKCVDYDEKDLGDISEQNFAFYTDQYIELRFTGIIADHLVIESIHLVDWK